MMNKVEQLLLLTGNTYYIDTSKHLKKKKSKMHSLNSNCVFQFKTLKFKEGFIQADKRLSEVSAVLHSLSVHQTYLSIHLVLGIAYNISFLFG